MGFLEESELRRESSSVPQVLSSAAGDRTDGKKARGLQQETLAHCRPTVRGEEERRRGLGTVSNIWRNCEKTESVLILLGA